MSRTPAVTPETFATFGDLLKYLRRRAGLTQRELSIAVGYSESLISRLEQNQRAPDEATLAARFVPALQIEHEPEWVARLFELAAPRAEGESERQGDETPPPNNLPIQLTSFIGREKETEHIGQLLSGHRLVTLIGPGGTGKTRLSLQVAALLLRSYPQGVWMVDFAPLFDPSLVPQTVAAILDVRERQGGSTLAALVDSLRERRLLLLLDNCEHLADACAYLIEPLLCACPDLRILATSREAFGIAGEAVFHVPSLAVPDANRPMPIETLVQCEAVRLFVERATAIMPDFIVADDNAPALVDVCRHLDGIPLAIELAAAKVSVLRVEQIAARLNDSFRLLGGGSRAALPRHRTLRATMDWSYDLLGEEEQTLLRRLSVFAGGWTLEAAEAVAGGQSSLIDADVLELLTLLVNKSLVVAERKQGREARYHLLETVRQYAREKLAESDEEDRVRERQYQWFLSVAERADLELMQGGKQEYWLNRLDVELDNVRAALDWSLMTERFEAESRLAASLLMFWLHHGFREGRTWLEAALTRRETLPKALLARTFRAAGRLAARQGDFDAAEKYSEAVQLFVDRAVAALPDFTLTAANAPAVAQVCQRLDGVALAIELAASRVKMLKVEQIAARLDDAFRLLTGGSRTALPCQQTLRATIDWSYSLLSETERKVLRRLSVFAGGWTLEAAESVCGGNGVDERDLLDLLTQLANKSLVMAEREQGADARYSFGTSRITCNWPSRLRPSCINAIRRNGCRVWNWSTTICVLHWVGR